MIKINYNFLENLSLVKNVYSKYYLRETLKKDKIISILDNCTTFEHVNLKNFNKGKSVLLNQHIYKHKEKLNLQIKKTSKIKIENTKLQNLIHYFRKKNKLSCILLRPTKGGFLAYTFGIIGFFPKTELDSIFLDSKYNDYLVVDKGNFNSIIMPNSISLKYLTLKFPCSMKLSINFACNKKVLIKKKYKKEKKFKYVYNIQFLNKNHYEKS